MHSNFGIALRISVINDVAIVINFIMFKVTNIIILKRGAVLCESIVLACMNQCLGVKSEPRYYLLFLL
jgi:hypothetical protein